MMPSQASTTTFTFLLVKTFIEVNGKTLTPTSKRADQFAGLLEQETEINLLKKELVDLKVKENIEAAKKNAAKFISFDQYKADILQRWGVHVKETTALGCDMTKAFKWLKVQFISIKSLSLGAE